MMKRAAVWAACLALGMIAAWGARAAESEAPKFPKQVVLSKAQVENVLATLGKVEALNRKYGEPQGDYSGGDIGENIRKALRDAGALNEFNGIVRAHGFTGFDDWWPVAFSAIAAANPADFPHDSTDFAEALANVQSNTKMTPAQKAAAITQINQGQSIAEQMRPLPQNIPTVAPYAKRINGALEVQE